MTPIHNSPLVCLISDGSLTDENFSQTVPQFFALVRAAIAARISIVQIREKQLSTSKFFELTQKCAAIIRNSETRLLVNDRADVALAANADGVHLTADSIPASIIRQNFPPDFIIGVSCHSLEEIEHARQNSADFAVFSPIFATPSKTKLDLPPQSLKKLAEICTAMKDFPIVALGGIDETNFQSVLETGAHGIAAIRWLNNPQHLSRIAQKIRNAK